MNTVPPATLPPPPQVPEIATGANPVAAEGTDEVESLMPFGAAAKAIFVKANGFPAYRKSIRSLRRDD